jgi:preprotein translocase subunit SecG
MQVLMSVMLVLQMLAGLVMIGLVLIQHGKGADMGASFGSGASGSLFGATGSANFLSRSTAVCAAVFFCCTLALAYLSNDRSRPASSGTSVLDRAAVTAPAASSASAAAAGQIPGLAPAPAAVAPAASEAASAAVTAPAPASAASVAPGAIPAQ